MYFNLVQNAVVVAAVAAAATAVGDIVDADAVVVADIAADIVVVDDIAADLVLNLDRAKLGLLAKDAVANCWAVIIIEHWPNDAGGNR